MNNNAAENRSDISPHLVQQFDSVITRLFQCCQERMQYQSEKFGLPDAELRCLLLFKQERYLTPKGIAGQMNVVKSRVSRITDGLVKKHLIQKLRDPEDSRVTLLSLTAEGHAKIDAIRLFQEQIYNEVLSQMASEQRKTMLTNLEMLKASMEAIRDLMV